MMFRTARCLHKRGEQCTRYMVPTNTGPDTESESDGKGAGRKPESFETIEEAQSELLKLQAQKEREGELTVEKALGSYEQHLTKVRQLKPRSVETTIYRLTRYFDDALKHPLPTLTRGKAISLYDSLTPMSVDSRLNLLAEVKTFFRWAVDRGFLRSNPAEKSRAKAAADTASPS